MQKKHEKRGKQLLRALYYARKADNPSFSQKVAAAEIGVARSTFSLNMSQSAKGRPIAAETAMKYAKFFDVPAQWFMDANNG